MSEGGMREGVSIGDVTRVEASHEIGLVTALKLVAICWAGTIPFVVPAWMIIKGQIASDNREQDDRIALHYVTKEDAQATKSETLRRFDEIQKKLDTITVNQQKVLVKLRVE